MKKGTVDESRMARLNLRMLSYAAAPAVALLSAGAAQAGVIDFTGSYSFGNWAQSGNGSVTDNTPGSITIDGPNGGLGFATQEDFTISVLQSGTWNFDWAYSSGDSGFYDSGWYILNSNATLVAWNSAQGSGNVSASVSAGDTIGWRVRSEDNLFGPGFLTISNFSIQDSSVPEPSTVSMLALGAAGLLWFRRRRVQA